MIRQIGVPRAADCRAFPTAHSKLALRFEGMARVSGPIQVLRGLHPFARLIVLALAAGILGALVSSAAVLGLVLAG